MQLEQREVETSTVSGKEKRGNVARYFPGPIRAECVN